MEWFSTKRLIIRDLEERDLEAFAFYRQKKEVALYQSWNHYSLKEAQYLYQRLQRSPFNGRYGMTQLAIERQGQLIGDLYLSIDFFKRHELFLGYTLDSSFWNQGYATEAVKGMCCYAFSHFAISQIVCYVMQENQRSMNVLKKIGFDCISTSSIYHDYGFCLKKEAFLKIKKDHEDPS